MDTVTVGVREFRERFSSYLESENPVVITRHGETLGYYIPTKRQRTDEDKQNLKEAWSRLQKVMKAKGITEEEIFTEIDRQQKTGRQRRSGRK